ncbi:MAG: HAD family hydrolase [Haliscomenobacter sp.]
MSSKIQLIIFDLDGTLVDSKYDLAAALTYALEPHGAGPVHAEDIPPLLGSGLGALLRMSLPTADEGVLANARQRFNAYYDAHTADLSPLYPGVRETLQQLHSVKKAVFSNKVHVFTGQILRQLQLDSYFDLSIGAQPDKYPLKPAPDGIRYILDQLGVAPGQTLMVGDSTHDLEAARAAGVRSCAVTYGYRPAEALRAHQPDFMVDSFEEILAIVAGFA